MERKTDDLKDATKGAYLGLAEDNVKLVEKFGASRVSDLKSTPGFYTFTNGLMHSHRDFHLFYARLLKGERSAVVSGLNASGTIHLGHVPVLDTNMFFQREHGAEVFIPLSDDESYVSLKVKSQEEALAHALRLARSMLAYGFDPKRTHIIIDQLYTEIYNLAVKLSRGVTMSELKSVYSYTNDQNIGLHFYPAIQAAHIVLPHEFGIRNTVVPIGPDEDAHLRICRDVAGKFGYEKPAVLHSRFLPGLDGQKMSKSKGNAVYLLDGEEAIRRKIMSAYSGGQVSVEEHRRLGGDPDVDVSYQYLKGYFLKPKEARQVYDDYRKGRLLSGELKMMFFERVMKRVGEFKRRYAKVTARDVDRALLKNEDVDVPALAEKLGVFES
jgi:tryptophanyl-tRNA synthetase